MTLQASGQIDFSDINVELGIAGTTQISLGQASVRALYGIPSGAIRLGADGYGKSNALVPVGVDTAGPPILYDFGATNNSFTASGATLTASGSTYSTINSTSTDPFIRRTGLSFSGAKYPYVEVYLFRINGTTGWDGNFFYQTASHGESALYRNVFTQPTWDGVNYQYMIIDNRNLVAGGTDWTTSTITGIRFDFGLSSVDDFRLDWIQLRGTIYPVAGLIQRTRLDGYHYDNTVFMDTVTTNDGATNSVVNGGTATENFTQDWRGYFLAPTTGIYNFYLSSDDASYMWIGNEAVAGYTTTNALVSSNWNLGTITSPNVQLTAGTYYPVRILWGNQASTGSLSFAFSGPGIAATTNGAGYFFYNADTTGI